MTRLNQYNDDNDDNDGAHTAVLDRVEQSARVLVADRVDYAPLELGRHDLRGDVPAAATRRRRGLRRALTLALMLLGLAASSAAGAGANHRQRMPRAHRLVAIDKHLEQQLRQPNRHLYNPTEYNTSKSRRWLRANKQYMYNRSNQD